MDAPTTQSVYTATRYLLMLGGAWLATHGYIKNTDVNDLVAAVMIVGPAAWGFMQNYINAREVKLREQVAVTAGANLALAGNAKTDASGKIASSFTAATTQQVIKDYGPPLAALKANP